MLGLDALNTLRVDTYMWSEKPETIRPSPLYKYYGYCNLKLFLIQ